MSKFPVARAFHSLYTTREIDLSDRKPPLVHIMPQTDALSAEECDALMDLHMPAGLGRRNVPFEPLYTSYGELSAEHVRIANAHVESCVPAGVKNPELLRIRHSHHRLAQLLAIGTAPGIAAVLCNYAPSRVTALQQSPAFIELVSFYAGEAKEIWADFVEISATLSKDALQELQCRLDEKPEMFSVGQLMELYRNTADRSGHAPVQKSLNVNVNADVGSRLNAAKERLRNVTTGSPDA